MNPLREHFRFEPGRMAWLPVAGIVLLLVLNAAFDILRPGGPGLFGSGAFLHIAFDGGIPAGATLDILARAAPIILAALGMTLVIATGGIDLSVGSVAALSGVVAASLASSGHAPLICILGALGAAGLCGLWNAFLVAVLRVQPFVATLLLMVAGRGIAQGLAGGQIVRFDDPFLHALGAGRPAWFLPWPFIVAAIVAVALILFARRTAFGLLLEAVGGSARAARLSGIRDRRLIALTYILSALTAGLAGLIIVGDVRGADPAAAGRNLELAAIFGAVVGGTSLKGGRFSLVGAVAGALLMQTLTATLYARDVRADVAPLPSALVIIFVCLIGSPFWSRLRTSRSSVGIQSSKSRWAGRLARPFHFLRSIRAQRTEASQLPPALSMPDAEPRQQETLPADSRKHTWFAILRRVPISAGLVIAAALFVFGGIRFDHFASPVTIGNLLSDYAFVGIAAVGATFVIASGGIDLSVGAVIAFSSILLATLINAGWHPAPAIAITLLAGAAVGGAMGLLTHAFELPPFMVTLAGMFAMRAAAFIVHPQNIAIDSPAFIALARSLDFTFAGIPFSIRSFLLLLVVLTGAIVLTLRPFGRAALALGSNEKAARAMALPVARTKIGVYVLAGTCSALAGIVFAMYRRAGDPASNIGLELDVIAAVVIGGTLLTGGVGTVAGSLIGVLILGLIRTLIDFQGTLDAAWTSIATALLLALFLGMHALLRRFRRRTISPR